MSLWEWILIQGWGQNSHLVFINMMEWMDYILCYRFDYFNQLLNSNERNWYIFGKENQ